MLIVKVRARLDKLYIGLHVVGERTKIAIRSDTFLIQGSSLLQGLFKSLIEEFA